MTIGEAGGYARRKLEAIGAGHEATLILRAVTEKPLARLLLDRDEKLSIAQTQAVTDAVARRIMGEPLQYIIGQWDFYGMEFFVSKSALIPRQDTEVLVECVKNVVKQLHCKTALDMCTGSGCIAITLAKQTGMVVCASDISIEALSLACKNASYHGVDIKFIQSDMFLNIKNAYDVIVCNPPYIMSKDIPKLMPEVREHEPTIALDGGKDGLDFYRILAQNAPEYLHIGGVLAVEVGIGQAERVMKMFTKAGFSDVQAISDYNEIKRVVVARKGNVTTT